MEKATQKRHLYATQKVSVSKEIRKFVEESRKCQTLYANFEGSYNRSVQRDDLTKLENFIFLTLSDGKGRDSLTKDEIAVLDEKTKLTTEKICSSNNKFNSCDKIHFHVTWIYFFDYSDDTMKSMPVFKIYKNWSRSKAVYIDQSLTEYCSWDHLIDFSAFPDSFICVPRNGEYKFCQIDGEELLDLEFMCKKTSVPPYKQIPGSWICKPFSQTAIKGVLKHVADIGRHIPSFLNLVIEILIKENIVVVPNWVVLIISGFSVCIKLITILSNAHDTKDVIESTLNDYSLMLPNDDGKERKAPSMDLFQRCHEIMAPEQPENPLHDNSFRRFLKLLKNPKQHVIEILKYVPVIINGAVHLFLTVAAIRESGPDFHKWIHLFEILSIFALGERNQMKQICPEKAHECLSNLEKISSAKIVSELNRSRREDIGPRTWMQTTDIQVLHGFRMFNFAIYILLKTTPSSCKTYVRKLLKSNCTFLKSETLPFEDIILDGKKVGIIISFTLSKGDHAIIAIHASALSEASRFSYPPVTPSSTYDYKL